MVFVNWVGFDEEGYSGTDLTASVNMTNNIHEYAFWKKQYYLNVSCDVPQAVSLVSGWYDENKIVGIEYIDLQGINFLGWIGSGNESYSGEDWGQNIKMLSPITQYAVIHREDFDLMVNSEYGEIWGQGSYPAYGYANFGVDNSFIYLSRNERMKFKGWSTNSDDGYTGNITEGTVLMSENTEQTANWVKQYYVQLNSTEGGNVTQASDWIDSGTILKVSTEGDQKYQFIEWIGEGDTAVNSEEKNITLFVTAPINQTAQWKKECTVLIMSALPTSGAGVYLEGDEVTLRAQTSEGLLIRRVFKKWSGGIDSTDPVFSFRITRDTSVMAEYEKNYTVFIMLVIVALMGVGVIAYRMLKS
jgi:hypothetical protein